jgi:hypothetical protein
MVRKSRCYRAVDVRVAVHSREEESRSLNSRRHIPWHSRCLSHSEGPIGADYSNNENSLNSQARQANRL